ncbi:class I SAM-dependent methyltransferase [Aromatoleum bremense]|uniref:Methyltransferase domain-containing protein n=1 Tax=Aromatoleum bremense TaxID=76115 RepID=A0ABX1NSD1_9RHOO|nr:methyltransferase domain-containing protein [Aromatoleum bremense]NMG14909.1 methyltransferase domain-containing protein [Aromatoleum bremense]QTQ32387.1 SAM-dependent methyltransferase [Aromatoleum bremense]
MKVLLHVGCGSFDIRHLPAYFQDGSWDELRYDINEAVEPDLIGTLQDMSMIEDGTIDAIYSSHNIEHVWSFEVPQVLAEFMRVLKPDGFAVVLCPDILSVAQAITKGFLGQTLYMSPAGPISAIDIMYGFQHDIEKGNLFMAHKTAFTAQTLAAALAAGGFAGSAVARDRGFGLYSVATKNAWDEALIKNLIDALHPADEYVLERLRFGCYTPSV